MRSGSMNVIFAFRSVTTISISFHYITIAIAAPKCTVTLPEINFYFNYKLMVGI